VMVVDTEDGERVKVLDFGLVKVLRDDTEDLTATGRFLGSPRYMSPEQILHHDLDGRSDLYALGVILFRALTGEVPFLAPTAFQTLMLHVQAPLPDLRELAPDVPEGVRELLEALLAKAPEDRPPDANTVVNRLGALLHELGGPPSIPPAAPAGTPASAGPGPAVETGLGMEPLAPPHREPVSTRTETTLQAGAPPPPAAPSPAWRLVYAVLALALLLCAAAVGAWTVIGLRMTPARRPAPPEAAAPVGPPTPTEPATAPPVEPAAPAPPAPPEEPAPLPRVRIVSTPPGASVRDDDDAVLGETPLDVEVGPDGLTVFLRRAGYLPHRVVLDGSEGTREVSLVRRRRRPRRPPSTAPLKTRR
jgi:hypothetical protein